MSESIDDAPYNVGLAVPIGALRDQLNLEAEGPDQPFLRSKILAATSHVENHLGFSLADFEDGTPEPVLEAIRQIAAHLYENREAVLIGQGLDAQELPFGVADLLSAYRKWIF